MFAVQCNYACRSTPFPINNHTKADYYIVHVFLIEHKGKFVESYEYSVDRSKKCCTMLLILKINSGTMIFNGQTVVDELIVSLNGDSKLI